MPYFDVSKLTVTRFDHPPRQQSVTPATPDSLPVSGSGHGSE